MLIRAPAPAVAAGVAYALPVEMLLRSAWADGAQWLPGGLLGALAAGGTSVVSYGRALTLVGLYTAVALIAVGVLFMRRDVTA
jgi:ABC-2 type transport system permease protein